MTSSATLRRTVHLPLEKVRSTTLWNTLSDRLFLAWLRVCAIAVWTVALGVQCVRHGVPLDRTGLGAWIVAGLICATIGRRAPWTVLIDWAPFLGVLMAYDYLRGAADTMGMPTWWTPQLNVDKFLFAGTEPTVWLQAKFRYPDVRWWDIATCIIYFSFFLAPYLLAGVLWLRGRSAFRQWAARFVTLSLFGFALFAVMPSAPPWAAASCTPAEVAGHPNDPSCLHYGPGGVPDGGLLGPMHHPLPGASHYVQRISTRGWSELHLKTAQSLLSEGQRSVDVVAAVPSLHAGGTLLIVLFLWRRVRVWWRVPLVAYAIAMPLALVYSAEHYVSDVLAGWLCAVLVHWMFTRFEQRRMHTPSLDTLDAAASPTASRMETTCPPPNQTPTRSPSPASPLQQFSRNETTRSSTSPSAAASSSPQARSTAGPDRPGITVHSVSN